jgi:hypothetical protein
MGRAGGGQEPSLGGLEKLKDLVFETKSTLLDK